MAYFKTVNGSRNKSSYEVIAFGQFKGLRAVDVVESYPSYIDWCMDNLDNFSLPPYLWMLFYKGIKESFIISLSRGLEFKIKNLKKICRKRFTKEQNQEIVNYVNDFVKSSEWDDVKEENKYLFDNFTI